MAKIIGLPKLSPTMEEGTLVAWVKKEGDEVDVDDLLAEVETDKATMEFRSFDRGVLLKILVPEGETLEPDVPVAIIGKAGEDISDLLAQVAETGSEAVTETETETGTAPVSAAVPVPAAVPASVPAPASVPVSASVGASVPVSAGRILSSPLVRRLARERSIDLSVVQGSGPQGRIVKRDVDSYDASSVGFAAVGAERLPPRVVKASSMRRTIARRLTESMQIIPHYYLTV
ncbi:MAG: E3 binding domain-containing protein, partial [Myxococcales bacterium]|nr:E3 binding domain-containing protein [Myxococcales bacterium]